MTPVTTRSLVGLEGTLRTRQELIDGLLLEPGQRVRIVDQCRHGVTVEAIGFTRDGKPVRVRNVKTINVELADVNQGEKP